MNKHLLQAATVAALVVTMGGVSAAAAVAPVNAPATSQTTAQKPNKPAKPVKPAKQTVKVLSEKAVKNGRTVFTDDRKPMFKDVKLKHKLGKTKVNSAVQYQIVKKAQLKVNGKKATYFQLKANHGKAFWINSHHILEMAR